MTDLLGKALRRIEALPPDEQDTIASQILDSLEGEKDWDGRSSGISSALRDLARSANEEHRRGETRPLDELLR